VAGQRGGTYPAAIAAADEDAVSSFLSGGLRFVDIPHLLADALEAFAPNAQYRATSLPEIMDADAWGRRYAEQWIKEHPWT
jgi:1-deoxy-D-xylulose-5-phosphate reductoisomerase